MRNLDELSKGTKKALEDAGITTMEQLKKAFNEAEIRGIRNIGVVSYNEICQCLKKFKSIRYSVGSLTCNVCRGKLTPVRWQNDDKEWLFGYLCSCTEKHRGKIGLDYAI